MCFNLKKLSFLIIFSILFSFSGFCQYNSINQPRNKTIPITLGYFVDTSNKIECNMIQNTDFIDTTTSFNPALFEDTLWLNMSFLDSKKYNGTKYNIGFGSEYLDFADLYVYIDNKWTYYGSTGNNIPAYQKSSSSWRLNIPLDLDDLPNQNIYQVRIKMKSTLGSPVKIKLYTNRDFERKTLILTISHFLIIGIFLFVAGFMLYYGFAFKDPVYKNLSISTLFFLLLQLQVTGLGQHFLWGFTCNFNFSPRLLYLFDFFLVLFLTLTFSAIMKEEHSNPETKKTIPLLHLILSCFLVITLFVKSNLAVNISFCIINILCSLLFISLIGVNTVGNKALRLQLFFQVPAFLLITTRQLFYILRTSADSPFYVMYTNDYFFINYLIFALIEIPPIYLTGKRLVIRFQELTHSAIKYKKENIKLIRQLYLYNSLAHEILDLNNIVRTSIRLPYKGDTPESKEISSLIERSIVQSTDMLNTVCIITGECSPEEHPILFKDFFDSCTSIILPTLKQRNIKLVSTIDLDNDFIVYADPNILEFILSDFMSTIIEYSPKNTEIQILLNNINNEINCMISTQMNNTELKSLKQAIEETDIAFSATNKIKSSLVGFNLIKKAIKFYGGSFSINPTISGYSFNIKIKFSKCSTISTINTDTPIINQILISENTKKYSDTSSIIDIPDDLLSIDNVSPVVLLIEESSQNRTQINNLLKKHCQIIPANTGIEAWDYLHNPSLQQPNYILCEYELPFLSGLELFRKCQNDENIKNIPFIMLLPVSQSNKKSELLIKGVSHCITKPFTQQELLDVFISLKNTTQRTYNTFMSQINNVINTKPALPQEQNTIETTRAPSTAIFSKFNLSSREQQIALLILEGKSDKEIASILNISPGTVASHNKNLFKKLEVHSRVELMNKLR